MSAQHLSFICNICGKFSYNWQYFSECITKAKKRLGESFLEDKKRLAETRKPFQRVEKVSTR
jgi:hypothetical protein